MSKHLRQHKALTIVSDLVSFFLHPPPDFLGNGPPYGPGPIPPYPFTSPPSTPYLLVSFTFPFFLSDLLHVYSCFFISSDSTKIVPLYFDTGCHRRQLNLALVFFLLILCYMYFLVKDAYMFCYIWFSFVLGFICCLCHLSLLGGCWTKKRPGLRLIYRWSSFTG